MGFYVSWNGARGVKGSRRAGVGAFNGRRAGVGAFNSRRAGVCAFNGRRAGVGAFLVVGTMVCRGLWLGFSGAFIVVLC